MRHLLNYMKSFWHKEVKIPSTIAPTAPPVPQPVALGKHDENISIITQPSTYREDLTALCLEDAYGISSNSRAELCSQQFKRHLKELFVSGANHDVELTFGEKTISAHRKILAARSSYFKTMLEGKMAESQQQTINIDEEQEYEPMRALLQYLYCEYIDFSQCNMLEL